MRINYKTKTLIDPEKIDQKDYFKELGTAKISNDLNIIHCSVI